MGNKESKGSDQNRQLDNGDMPSKPQAQQQDDVAIGQPIQEGLPVVVGPDGSQPVTAVSMDNRPAAEMQKLTLRVKLDKTTKEVSAASLAQFRAGIKSEFALQQDDFRLQAEVDFNAKRLDTEDDFNALRVHVEKKDLIIIKIDQGAN